MRQHQQTNVLNRTQLTDVVRDQVLMFRNPERRMIPPEQNRQANVREAAGLIAAVPTPASKDTRQKCAPFAGSPHVPRRSPPVRLNTDLTAWPSAATESNRPRNREQSRARPRPCLAASKPPTRRRSTRPPQPSPATTALQ